MSTIRAWSDGAERDLLLVMIGGSHLDKADWPAIGAKMAEKGYGFTAEGCRHRWYSNLRPHIEVNDGSPSQPKTATPSKRKKAAAGDGNGANEDGTPTKRKRRSKKEIEAAKAMANEEMGGPVKHPFGDDVQQGMIKQSQEMENQTGHDNYDAEAEFDAADYAA